MTDDLGDRFRQFASQACTGRTADPSPLYEHLSLELANDPELLALVEKARDEQPAPNLLYAAIQFLLFQTPDPSLGVYYPSIGPETRAIDEGTYSAFREFCLENETEVTNLITTRRVQTNAVRRSACLLPAFESVSRRTDRSPLGLVEVGSSAGLNLLWDQYGYDYGGFEAVGCNESRVQLNCGLRGRVDPPLPTDLPVVGSRRGIDLHPMNIQNEDDARWLKALIWPEHEDRRENVENAITVARESPPDLIEGNALENLEQVIDEIPDEQAVCLFNTHVLYQLSDTQRVQFYNLVTDIGENRDIYWVSCEWSMDVAMPLMHLYQFESGIHSGELLARYHSHGSWLQWLRP